MAVQGRSNITKSEGDSEITILYDANEDNVILEKLINYQSDNIMLRQFVDNGCNIRSLQYMCKTGYEDLGKEILRESITYLVEKSCTLEIEKPNGDFQIVKLENKNYYLTFKRINKTKIEKVEQENKPTKLTNENIEKITTKINGTNLDNNISTTEIGTTHDNITNLYVTYGITEIIKNEYTYSSESISTTIGNIQTDGNMSYEDYTTESQNEGGIQINWKPIVNSSTSNETIECEQDKNEKKYIYIVCGVLIVIVISLILMMIGVSRNHRLVRKDKYDFLMITMEFARHYVGQHQENIALEIINDRSNK